MRRHHYLIHLTAVIAWLWAVTATADSPTAFVKGILDRVLAIQNDPTLAGEAQEPLRAKAIRQIIQKSFDFAHMARSSLGPTYDRLTPGQRQEFTQIFSYLFQDSYTRLVLNFLKKETVQYHQETRQDGQARVNTTLVRPNESIPVDYLLHQGPQNWQLYDVIVDGVSILNNYKSQFAKIMESKSFDFLLDRLRAQYRSLQ